ncbi:MAG TPA: Hpt domain-containing protein [Acidobacteriaceae bacterium]|jgi:HPt (histidine-containing phosphotransfer) domain-containing protein
MNAAQAESTRKMLAGLWQRNLPVVRERVDEMQRAATAAAAGELTPEARASAGSTAHKLAGSLGMFGYQHGTEIARQLEEMLEATGEINASKLEELTHELRQEVKL